MPRRCLWSQLGRSSCAVCKHQSRACACGWQLAKGMVGPALRSLVLFVRGTHTPVLELNSPTDQKLLQKQMAEILGPGDSPAFSQCPGRFAALAALLGRPECLQELAAALAPCSSDDALYEALLQECESGKILWRGGQAHGGMSRKALPSAFRRFCVEILPDAAAAVRAWHTQALAAAREEALRDLLAVAQRGAKLFIADHYWRKRFLEITLLGLLSVQSGTMASTFDLDRVADEWPV